MSTLNYLTVASTCALIHAAVHTEDLLRYYTVCTGDIIQPIFIFKTFLVQLYVFFKKCCLFD